MSIGTSRSLPGRSHLTTSYASTSAAVSAEPTRPFAPVMTTTGLGCCVFVALAFMALVAARATPVVRGVACEDSRHPRHTPAINDECGAAVQSATKLLH